DCVISSKIDAKEEDEIGWHVANMADRELSFKCNGKSESVDTPEMLAMKQLTGGYILYLRENDGDLLDNVVNPDWAKRKCQRLGKFVSYMRCRPPKKQKEATQRELSYRL